MTEDARDLPVIERDVVRLVVLDALGRVLLLHVRDLTNPQFGTCWELPGGGREANETLIEAAVRELREETGLELAPERLNLSGAPTWRRDVAYTYRGMRRLQHECILAVRLNEELPRVTGPQGVGFELEDLFESRWWTVDEIRASDAQFYPRSLPQQLPVFLAGTSLEEALEVWP